MVEVHGSGYAARRTACVFGTSGREVVRAEVASSSLLSCMAPAGVQGSVALEVTGNDGADSTQDKQEFRYVEDGMTEGVEPSYGPEAGGTVVTVTGRGFVSTGHVVCRVGSSGVSRGTWRSASIVTCVMPAGEMGNTTVEVSNTGEVFARSRVPYAYRSVLGIVSIVPSIGPVDGGTMVRVVMSMALNASEGLQCAFGSKPMRMSGARVVSSRAVECITPAVQERQSVLAELTIMSGAAVLAESGGASFLFSEPMRVVSVRPSIGSVRGGTMVEVHGSGYAARRTACVFGTSGREVVRAEVTSSSLLSCMAPAGVQGSVALEVTGNDGADSTQDKQEFRYVEDGMTEGVEPSYGPEAGGTVVTVTGRGFVSTGHVVCRVGSSGVSRGTWRSASMVTCVMPARRPGNTTVEVSNTPDGAEGGGSKFVYRPAMSLGAGPVPLASAHHGDGPLGAMVSTRTELEQSSPTLQVEGVVPGAGEARGGAAVSVIGRGFERTARCVFGSIKVTVRVLSSSVLRCMTPEGSAGVSMAVEVSNDGETYSTSGVEYSFVADMVVERVVPSRGDVEGTGVVTVYGRHFMRTDRVGCRFGGTHSVVGRWQSSTALVCAVPAGHAGNASVEVSHDGLSFTESGVQYWYGRVATALRLTPSVGHVSGGTAVSVLGRDLGMGSVRAGCVFCGRAFVVGRLVSSTLVVCSSPAQEAGRCTVEVSPDGGVEQTRAGLEYEYRAGSVVRAILPSLGPVSGGTEVRVVGEGLRGSHAECRFGILEGGEARLSSSSTVLWCRSPARSAEGTAAVEVSLDGLPFSGDGHRFMHYRRRLWCEWSRQQGVQGGRMWCG